MIYTVYWPAAQVLKVGVAAHLARVRGFTDTGATVIMLTPWGDRDAERRLHRRLAERFPRAFHTADESRSLIPRTRGFSECYHVPANALEGAVGLIVKVVSACP